MGQKDKKVVKKLEKGLGTANQVLATYGANARCELQLLSQAPDVLPSIEVQNALLWCLHPGLGQMHPRGRLVAFQFPRPDQLGVE